MLSASRAQKECLLAASARLLQNVSHPDGADVAITYVSSPAGAQSTVAAVQALGMRADAFQADLADASAVASAVDKAAALDRGEIKADGSQLPVCEVELELKGGEPSQLFETAKKAGRNRTCAAVPAEQSSTGL